VGRSGALASPLKFGLAAERSEPESQMSGAVSGVKKSSGA